MYLLPSLLKDFLQVFLPLKTCSLDIVSGFAIPENACLLLYQQEEQETGRPTAAKRFKMTLDEFMKGII